MKFAHMADVHLGAWSGHTDLKDYPQMAFEKAIGICISERVDFVLICGDFFDTSLPSVDVLKFAAEKLKELKENGISVYVIAGSHDFSPTGKTMLSVLESAGLLKIVSKADLIDDKIKLKFTIDEKTGTAITGMIGRRLGLEKSYYENLICELPDGFKIFMLHSAIAEYKPQHLKDMSSLPLSLIPKGFDYYAAGHVHEKFIDEKNRIFYPGPLFPMSFNEFSGETGFFVVDSKNGVHYKQIKIRDATTLVLSADGKTPKQVEAEAIGKMEKNEIREKIVLLRFEGILDGNTSDIDYRKIEETAKSLGAGVLKRSTSGLRSREFEEIKVEKMGAAEIEESLISEHLGKIKVSGNEYSAILSLMNVLNDQKQEGETKDTFEDRLKKNAIKIIDVGEKI